MEIGVCKLCLNEKKLCDSHIIPKFIYKPTEDKLNRSVPISINNVYDIIQSGIKEPMLCEDCEKIFQKYEKKLEIYLSDIQELKMPNVQRKESVILTTNYDFSLIKLAILSILWRLSHTKEKRIRTNNTRKISRNIQKHIIK